MMRYIRTTSSIALLLSLIACGTESNENASRAIPVIVAASTELRLAAESWLETCPTVKGLHSRKYSMVLVQRGSNVEYLILRLEPESGSDYRIRITNQYNREEELALTAELENSIREAVEEELKLYSLEGEEVQEENIDELIRMAELECTPAEGIPREEVEKIFGEAEPVRMATSVAKDTEREGNYSLCENCTLWVGYVDSRVWHAEYENPFIVHGKLPFEPDDEMNYWQKRRRFRQMKRIQQAYRNKLEELESSKQ